MMSNEAGLSARGVRWLCFSTAVLLLVEIATYHSLAEFVGRVFLGRTGGPGPAALAVQIFRVLPVGLGFLLVSLGAIVLVNQSRPRRLWLLLAGLFLCNALLLLWSVSEDYRQLDEARRRGGAVSSSGNARGNRPSAAVRGTVDRGSPSGCCLGDEDAA